MTTVFQVVPSGAGNKSSIKGMTSSAEGMLMEGTDFREGGSAKTFLRTEDLHRGC